MKDISTAEEAFRAAAAEIRVNLPDEILADGKIHRCEVEGEQGKQNGAYLYHPDGVPAGWFQNWKRGKGQTWCGRDLSTLSPAEQSAHRDRLAAMHREQAAEQERVHAEKGRLATWIFDNAQPATSHPYLDRKGVKSYGLRLNRDGRLVVPGYDSDGQICTLQFTDDDGNKRFLKAAKKAGCSFAIGEFTGDLICLCEGYATGASIHEATGYFVIVAFDSGNLLPVAEAVRAKYPTAKIIICADDDYGVDGNPGVTRGAQAAQAVRGLLAIPDFGESRPAGATDFNDLHQARGLATVKASIDAAVSPGTPDGAPPRLRVALTDTGNAERFADMFGIDVRFVPEWGKFFVWNGQFWAGDSGSIRVLEMTKDVARSFLLDAHACRDDNQRAAIIDHARRAEQEPKRKAMLALVQAEPPIPMAHAALDCDRMLLNVQNGTLDLHTGKLKPHDRGNLITRILPVAYNPDATCPLWLKFLGEVLPDEETIAFIQRAIGYSITGDVSEHCLFFLHGLGANGKSVFLLVFLALLGEYATQAPTAMLLARSGETHPTELTTLHGRRMAVCQETPSGKGWAEEIIKHITGGDRISARRMREDFWQFEPTHKLWVSGNHKPVVRGTDEGIWRRLRLVPFERVIPEAERDPKLTDRLCAELPGILTWAVQGCLTWQRDGLGMSAKVKAATADYREESDRLGPFLAECCQTAPDAVVSRKEIYRKYVDWAEEQGERWPMSERSFADAMHGHGFSDCYTQLNGKRCRGWGGIALASNTCNSSAPSYRYNSVDMVACETNQEIGANVLPPVAAETEELL